jgi:uncharacterized protein (TIGR00297 family)
MVVFLTLDGRGIALAFAFGIMIILTGGKYNLLFIMDMLVFLLMSAIVTFAGKARKEKIGTYEKVRGWKNVASNGLAPVLISIFYYFNSTANFLPGMFIVLAYMSSAAAISADKFASEIGVLDGQPIMLIGMEKVKKGTSGAVTPVGLVASFVAALVIGIGAFLQFNSFPLVLLVSVAGFLGNIVDSLFGFYEEKGIGNKYTTNLACSVAGAFLCLLVLLLIG